MSGRREMDDKYIRMTEKLLNKTNKILYNYYVDLKVTKTASTTYQYVSRMKVFFDYLSKEKKEAVTYAMLNDIKPTDINVFLNWYKYSSEKEKSDSMMALMFNIINSFFIFLELNEYIDKNPCRKLKAQKIKVVKAPTFMTEEEVKLITNYILYNGEKFYHSIGNEMLWKSRDYLMFMIGCRTGLRISAICSIDVNDIDFDNNSIIVVEKEKETRQIYFGNSTKKLLQEWLKMRDDYLGDKKHNIKALFITYMNKRITPVGARNALNRYFEIIPNKHITPHKMRSTCAQRLWEETSDLYLVSSVLGHHSVETTKKYTMVDYERKKNAARTLDKLFD